MKNELLFWQFVSPNHGHHAARDTKTHRACRRRRESNRCREAVCPLSFVETGGKPAYTGLVAARLLQINRAGVAFTRHP